MSKLFKVNENGELEAININKKEDQNNMLTLNLSFLNIYSIQNNLFFNEENSPKFPNLKVLDVSNNFLSDLNLFPDLFNKGIFENLEVLILNNNEITHIEYKFFEKLPKLKELHLAFNKIYKINSISFSDDNTKLPELEYIYLNNNYISQLSDTLQIIKKNIPFLNNEIYNLNEKNKRLTMLNIHENSIFTYLNKDVIIDLNHNLLIKCNTLNISPKSFKIKNYAYIYNFYLTYYYEQTRLLFTRYNDHNDYIEHIKENGINTFMDYFIYFIYESFPLNKRDIYLSYFLILNGNLDFLKKIEIDEYLNENNKYYYTYNNNESNSISVDLIINNIIIKKDLTKISEKNINDNIKILFKINNDFYKQNKSVIISINKQDDEDEYYKDNKYASDYLVRIFNSFNDKIYNLNVNIYLENSDLTFKNKDSILFINTIYKYYNYNKSTDSDFLKKSELNDIFKDIIINFNESIQFFSNELQKEFIDFDPTYIFPENINHLNNANNTLQYYKRFEYHINFLNKNIQYILLNEDDWNLLFKEEYKNVYISILNHIYAFLEKNNLYLSFLLVNNDQLIRYYENSFFQKIIDLYKKCALNLYIKESNNIIFYHLLMYLNLYDTTKNEFDINHLTSIQIDSLMDYYIMYMNELYNTYSIKNHYNEMENNTHKKHINNYINKYLYFFFKNKQNILLITLTYNTKIINKYFYKDYIKIYFDKFRIISGHGSSIKDTLMIIPENQTVHFLVKSKEKLSNKFNLKNNYIHNIPYQGVYQRGFDKFENYYITRPLYKTHKYKSGMLCESYYIDPKSVYDSKKKPSLNMNINNALQKWRYGGIFKINSIFKNVCKTDLYKKYENPINRKDNIFINSIYNNNENNYYKLIDYSFILYKVRDTILKKLHNSGIIRSLNIKNISKENKDKISKEIYKEMANYKNMYIDFLQKIMFGESDKSYFSINEIMQFYLVKSYAEKDYKLINFLKKNLHTSHTYFIHMCRGIYNDQNNKLLKHILKNVLQLHLLVESKKKYINNIVSKNNGLIKRNLLVPVIENNSKFLKNINVKGHILLSKNNSQISLSTQFSEDHFDINNYSLYKIYQDISHIINIYQKNYPKEQLRNNYHLNIIAEGLEKLYDFIYESYEISYEDMYKILKKLLVLKKLVFTHINIESVEGVGVNRTTFSNINSSNILQLSESNKEKYKVSKNIILKKIYK